MNRRGFLSLLGLSGAAAAIGPVAPAGALLEPDLVNLAAAKITGIQTDNISNFASGLQPIEIVAILPNSDNFPGRMVFLTEDCKLYLHSGWAWVSATGTETTKSPDAF